MSEKKDKNRFTIINIEEFKSYARLKFKKTICSVKEDKALHMVIDLLENVKRDVDVSHWDYISDELHEVLAQLESMSASDFEYDLDYHFERCRRADIQSFVKRVVFEKDKEITQLQEKLKEALRETT